jgi:hypothetical protein
MIEIFKTKKNGIFKKKNIFGNPFKQTKMISLFRSQIKTKLKMDKTAPLKINRMNSQITRPLRKFSQKR